jgi:hypothetical protein
VRLSVPVGLRSTLLQPWFGATGLLVRLAALVLVLAGCSSSSEPSATETEPSATHTERSATYTGGACEYDIPSEFGLNSTVTFTVTNESDTPLVGFAVRPFPEGTTPEEVLDEGVFEFVSKENFGAFLKSPSAVGTSRQLTVTFDEPGQWGLNCFDESGGDHGGEGLDYVKMFTVTE